MEQFLVQAAGMAITAILTGAVYAISRRGAAKTEVSVNGNRSELRVNKLYAWLGWISAVIGFALFFIVPFVEWDNSFYWTAPLLFLLFGPVGIYLVMAYHYHRVTFDGDVVYISNWRGQVTNIPWATITDISYRPNSGYLKLHTTAGKFRVSDSLVGLNLFLRELAARTRVDTSKLNLPF